MIGNVEEGLELYKKTKRNHLAMLAQLEELRRQPGQFTTGGLQLPRSEEARARDEFQHQWKYRLSCMEYVLDLTKAEVTTIEAECLAVLADDRGKTVAAGCDRGSTPIEASSDPVSRDH